MKAHSFVAVVLVTAAPTTLVAQGSVPRRIADNRSELADIFRTDAKSGAKIDYRSVILHNDGSMTTITDQGDTHNVTGKGRTEQTVGRGASHTDVLRTHYRPAQGDILYVVERLNPGGSPTRIYSSNRLKSDMAARAAGNAYGQRMQDQQAAQYAAQEEKRKREAEQQRKDERGVDHGGSHDRESARESHPDVRLGEGSVSVKPK